MLIPTSPFDRSSAEFNRAPVTSLLPLWAILQKAEGACDRDGARLRNRKVSDTNDLGPELRNGKSSIWQSNGANRRIVFGERFRDCRDRRGRPRRLGVTRPQLRGLSILNYYRVPEGIPISPDAVMIGELALGWAAAGSVVPK